MSSLGCRRALGRARLTDVIDKPMAGEESWVEPAPISLQPFGESGGFVGKVQFRNIRVRTP